LESALSAPTPSAATTDIPDVKAALQVLEIEERYLIRHIDADCGLMAGDIEGSFHRVRAQLENDSPSRPTASSAYPQDTRHFNILAEALAEVKATIDGKSDQLISDIVMGCLAEIDALPATPPSSGNADAVREQINARLEDLATANALYGKDQRLSAPEKIDRNNREISWLKDLRSLIALSSAPVAGEWQDISTAPMDGTWVLVWEDYGTNNKFSPADVARYDLGYWQNGEKARVHNATHWRPLPGRPIPRHDRAPPQPNTNGEPK
jgi:hypothetical protein